ncbi:6098_t:CDS:2, partial [Racocetra persica]
MTVVKLKQLREWISQKLALMKVVPYIQKLVSGAKPKYPELEADYYMIQAKAHSLAATSSYQNQFHEIENHKFFQKWVDRFMSRHNLVN